MESLALQWAFDSRSRPRIAELTRKSLLAVQDTVDTILAHQKRLEARREAYIQYLRSCERGGANALLDSAMRGVQGNEVIKPARQIPDKVLKKCRSQRWGHPELEQQGVVQGMRKSVPPSITKKLQYVFTEAEKGVFIVDAIFSQFMDFKILAAPVEVSIADLIAYDQSVTSHVQQTEAVSNSTSTSTSTSSSTASPIVGGAAAANKLGPLIELDDVIINVRALLKLLQKAFP